MQRVTSSHTVLEAVIRVKLVYVIKSK